jgi:HTH-type transcriptional regulator/antitoxin HigA
MIRRNWIEASDNIEVLEDSVRRFFNVENIGDDFSFAPFAARKSGSRASLSPEQNAWLFRALQLSKAVSSGVFSKPKFSQVLAQLQPLLSDSAEIRKVPQVLAANGIRFVVVEALPQSKVDGATFWLKNTPVVVLSLRYDRIDYFWYTLMHELGHVKNEDGKENDNIALDIDLEADRDRREVTYEHVADRFASDFLVSREALDDFVARVRPLYSRAKIVGFASRMGVHPGLVVGQIHYREKIYSHFREFLVKVREIVTSAALSDGWGSPFPAPAVDDEA